MQTHSEPPDRREASAVRPPQVTWITAAPPGRDDLTCPNCASTARKVPVAAVDFITPDHPLRRTHVLRCPDCTCCFYDDQNPPDYAEDAMLQQGRASFYVQQGAGLWAITRPLGQLRHPPGSRYLEVGCGYGFGLDYALRGKHWDGRGIDPAALSRLGRDALNLPIELRYLAEDEPDSGTMDVVMASEVLEHVPSPPRFIAILKRMLRPGGTLVLTTPNAEHLQPGVPSGVLVPLLSPGLHLVLFTAAALRRLLEDAGFAQVRVETDAHSLLAFASDTALDLEADTDLVRQAFVAYLTRRAGELKPGSDVFLGVAGRAVFEAVNADDLQSGAAAWERLVPACRQRFGLDIDTIVTLPKAARSSELEGLARLIPLNLCLLTYADAMRRLRLGTPRAELESRFAVAAAAADALRRALGWLAMEDGLTEDLGWTAAAESLLCAAAAGQAEPARWAALPESPSAPGRRRGFIERALTTLVNAGYYGPAAVLAAAESLDQDPTAGQISESRRDSLFSLAILDSQADGDAESAARRFGRVRDDIAIDHHLFWPALRGELQARRRLGQTQEVAALAEEAIAAARAAGRIIPEDLLAYQEQAAG